MLDKTIKTYHNILQPYFIILKTTHGGHRMKGLFPIIAGSIVGVSSGVGISLLLNKIIEITFTTTTIVGMLCAAFFIGLFTVMASQKNEKEKF